GTFAEAFGLALQGFLACRALQTFAVIGAGVLQDREHFERSRVMAFGLLHRVAVGLVINRLAADRIFFQQRADNSPGVAELRLLREPFSALDGLEVVLSPAKRGLLKVLARNQRLGHTGLVSFLTAQGGERREDDLHRLSDADLARQADASSHSGNKPE